MTRTGIFSRLSNLYNETKKKAGIYGPLLSQALKSPFATALLGGRAQGLAGLIDQALETLPAISKTIDYDRLNHNIDLLT